MVTLVAELRGRERQTAEELSQWKTGVEEPKPLYASPAARALELEERAVIDAQVLVPAAGQAAVPTIHETVFSGEGGRRGFATRVRRVGAGAT